MKNYDPWYLRLPDGRVVKAKSTSSVRHHVAAGNIPLNSMARREVNDEWVSLIWIAEFSDLGGGSKRHLALTEENKSRVGENGNLSVPGKGISARLDPLRLQTVGIRGLVDELIAAFDSAIGAGKGTFACATLSLTCLSLYLAGSAILTVYPGGFWLIQLLAYLIGGGAVAVIVAVLTRQTHLEVSTLKSISFAQAWRDSGRFSFRVYLSYVVTFGVCAGGLFMLGQCPDLLRGTLSAANSFAAETLLSAVWALSVLIAVCLVTMAILAMLLPPILVVEECSVGDALREWRSLLREHRIRVMVYEGLAIALAVIAALPLGIPVYVTLHFLPPTFANWFGASIPIVLYAIVAGPALTFLAVANLFIYLNLRYEYSPSQ